MIHTSLSDSEIDDRPWTRPDVVRHSLRLLRSYWYWAGHDLIAVPADDVEAARDLFHAPFGVVSAGLGPDALFTYANRRALDAFEFDWEAMLRYPGRYAAAPADRPAREAAIAQALRAGFVTDYEGMRVSAKGRRFRVEAGRLWNVLDERGELIGQGAALAIRPR